MAEERLGIAVPSFNQTDHLTVAIASLRSLSIPFTAIVQDGGSSQATIALLRRAIGDDDRIRLVVEPDEGQADAINRAWSRLLPDHPYLTWFNTDDVLYPDGIAALVERLTSSPSVAVAYGDLDLIDDDGRPVGAMRAPSKVRRFRLVYHHNLVPGIVPVVRASTVRQVGMLDPELHFAMDHDLFVRLAGVGELRRVPVKVAAYRLHDTAKTVRDKPALEAEIARVRRRYRRLPRALAEIVRLALRLAWWPTRKRYVRTSWRRTEGEPDGQHQRRPR